MQLDAVDDDEHVSFTKEAALRLLVGVVGLAIALAAITALSLIALRLLT